MIEPAQLEKINHKDVPTTTNIPKEPDLIKEYEDLSKKCDLVLEKISIRHNKTSK